jgi:tetratricopeptide (TPR) repeat protein
LLKKNYKIILIMALTVIAYWPIFSAGFMYDDRFFVQENSNIREWRNIPDYFIHPVQKMASIKWDGIWRPLRTVSYLTDYKIWGSSPLGFHLTNLLWHLLNIFLLSLLLDRLFKNEKLTLAACLIFALHPAQTEAVAWISSRGDLMFLSFGLAAFILFLSYRESRKYRVLGLSCFSFIVALLSKETAIVLPALFFVHQYIFADQRNLKATLSNWKPYAAYLSIIIMYFVFRRLALGMVSQCPYWGDSFWTTGFTMIRVAVDYVRLLFLPLWLRVDYVYGLSSNFLDWKVLGSLGILSALTIAAIRDLKNKGFLVFGWSWFVIGLLPVSNIFPITTLLAERFLYLPLIGFAVWAGYLWSKLADRKLAAAILVLVLPAMMVLSVKRNREWQDPLPFWTIEASRSPDSFIAHDYLGNLYCQKGDLPTAESEFLKAVEIDSTYVNSLYGLALVYVQQQRYDQAIVYAAKDLALDPKNHNAYVTLGIAYAGLGDLEQAERSFKQALSIAPGSKEAWNNLGIVYSRQGSWNQAVEAYSRTVALDPGGLETMMSLALACEKADPVRAITEWRMFLQTAHQNGQQVNHEFVNRRIEALQKNEKK